MRCLGVAPLAPNATMCVLIAEAPALVPATTEPWRWRRVIASASGVPPIVEDSRSWLPPVRKTPVASRTVRTAIGSEHCARVVAWIGCTSAAPSSVKTRRYISPANGPSEEAVQITAIRASWPPASVTKRDRMAVPELCPPRRR